MPSHHCVVRFRQRRPVRERGSRRSAEAFVARSSTRTSRWPRTITTATPQPVGQNGSLAFPLERTDRRVATSRPCLARSGRREPRPTAWRSSTRPLAGMQRAVRPAASTSAAPRSRRSSSATAGCWLPDTRRPPPAAPDVAAAMADAVRRRPMRPAPSRATSRVSDRLPRAARSRDGRDRAQPARLADAYPLRDVLADALGTQVTLGNDVQVATDAEFALGAARRTRRSSACSGAPASAAGSSWTAKPVARPGRPARSATWWSRGARCPCGRRGCMEAYAGRLVMEPRAQSSHEQGRKTAPVRDHGGAGRDRLTSGVWARPRRRGGPVATKLIDRAIARRWAPVSPPR